jgi:hypothetical protein
MSQELSGVPQDFSDGPERRHTRLWAAPDPGLLAVGAVLLMCAPALPGLSRLVVLPALVLAPGYALLRLLGQAPDRRSIAIAVPASLILVILASLCLDVSGIPLGSLSLGLTLGAATALFLAASHGRQLAAGAWLRRKAARRLGAVHDNPAVGGRR